MAQEIEGEEVVSKRPHKKAERRRREAQEAEAASRAALRVKLSRRLGKVSLVMSSAHYLMEIFYKRIIKEWDEQSLREAAKKRGRGKQKASKKLVTNSAQQRKLRAGIREQLQLLREAVVDYVFSLPRNQLESWMEAFLALEKSKHEQLPAIFGISREALVITTASVPLNEAIASAFCLIESEEEAEYAVEHLTRAMLISVVTSLRYNFSVQSYGIPVNGRRDEAEVAMAIYKADDAQRAIWVRSFAVRVTAIAASEGRHTPFDS